MIQTVAGLSNRPRAVMVVLGMGTAAGWSMLAISDRAAETERHLQVSVASLQADQKRLLAERALPQIAATEVAQLRK